MRRVVQVVVTFAVLMSLAAISPSALAAQVSAAAAAPKKPAKGRANLITEEEITTAGTGLQNAFLVVQRLRPQMLRVRSGSTSGGSGNSSMDVASNEMMVYLDSQRVGGVDALREIQSNTIREIRYLSASDATTLFGTGHMAGAIQLVTKR